jgi:hypothetical protein
MVTQMHVVELCIKKTNICKILKFNKSFKTRKFGFILRKINIILSQNYGKHWSLATVVSVPFLPYRYSKYHRPTSFGFQLDVHTFRNISRPLKTSCHPYIARGKVSLIKSISLSCPSAEKVWFGPYNDSKQIVNSWIWYKQRAAGVCSQFGRINVIPI